MIESDRIYLLPIELGDEYLLHELDANPNVVKYVGGVHYSIEQYRSMVIKFLNPNWAMNNCGFYKAFLKETNEFLGWFHLRPEDEQPNNYKLLEIGYRLKEEFWNRGLSTEMSKVLINMAFIINKCDTVSAIALKENHASRKVMVKCGLRFSENIIYYGLDCVKYIIDKDAFFNI